MIGKFMPLRIAYLGVLNVKKVALALQQEQEKVNAYFQSQSSFWKDIYARSGVHAEIYRDRHAAILN